LTVAPSLEVADLQYLGTDLHRPENVLGFRDGTVFVSSNQGFITRIEPDGSQLRIGSTEGAAPTTMALESDRSLIVNDTSDGNVHRLDFDGTYETIIDEIDGEPLGAANYVLLDRRDRLWIAVASRTRPPRSALEATEDGCIAVVEDGRARIVADGFRWPNEVRLDADEKWAYVPETMGGRVVRLPVSENGDLGQREVFGPDSLGEGALPDGIALDQEGNVWVAIVTRNGLMMIDSEGRASTIFEQPQEQAVAELAKAFESGTVPMGRVQACAGPDLKLLTSVGFLGPDLRTIVMGSLKMDRLVKLEAPAPGLPLRHQLLDQAPPPLPAKV
jgi:sugar lactone lactonase YvrE